MSLCSRIEEYLSNELPTELSREFEDHLVQCNDCRLEVDSHHEWERLASKVKQRFDSESSAYHQRIRSRLASVEQRHRFTVALTQVAVGLGSAAAVVFAIAWAGGWPPARHEPPASLVNQRTINPDVLSPRSSVPPQPSISVDAGSPYLVVPVESVNPDVTVYWFHPTVGEPTTDDASMIPFNEPSLLARSW